VQSLHNQTAEKGRQDQDDDIGGDSHTINLSKKENLKKDGAVKFSPRGEQFSSVSGLPESRTVLCFVVSYVYQDCYFLATYVNVIIINIIMLTKLSGTGRTQYTRY
jgi:hypothetical protein